MTELKFAQREGSCYCCGKIGQLSSRCQDNIKPKWEWAKYYSWFHSEISLQHVYQKRCGIIKCCRRV